MGALSYQESNQAYNPLGTQGFAFVEFHSAPGVQLHDLFTKLGFVKLAKHHCKAIYLYQQGDIQFLLNQTAHGYSADFSHLHGPSACAMAFQVSHAEMAANQAAKRGAVFCKQRQLEFRLPALKGIGGSHLYLLDKQLARSQFHSQFELITSPGAETAGLTLIDHLTHNVFQGNMNKWAEYYEKIFNFKEIRYFDIKGQHTGLLSRAMTSPCGNIRIPINEGTEKESQIEEYLRQYSGEGIQHIALETHDIYNTVEKLRKNKIPFMSVPDSYYDGLAQRLPEHKEPIQRLKENKILIDGHKEDGKWCLLLQIFTEPVIGPIFFEIIQRKGDQGFGEGNFQALFEAMERDQQRRGILT